MLCSYAIASWCNVISLFVIRSRAGRHQPPDFEKLLKLDEGLSHG